MIRFDYINSARPALLRRLGDLRLPENLRAPVCAIGAALIVVVAAWLIESDRLSRALALESSFKTQYQTSRLDLSKVNVLYAGLERMVSLEKQVRSIQSSGDAQALRLADIGNRLPPHVWLTAIEGDSSGFDLSGRAADVEALSHTLSGLSRARYPYTVTLLSASRDDRTLQAAPMQYQLRLAGTP